MIYHSSGFSNIDTIVSTCIIYNNANAATRTCPTLVELQTLYKSCNSCNVIFGFEFRFEIFQFLMNQITQCMFSRPYVFCQHCVHQHPSLAISHHKVWNPYSKKTQRSHVENKSTNKPSPIKRKRSKKFPTTEISKGIRF